MEVRGRELVSGLPKTVALTSEEVREALAEPVAGDRRRGQGDARADAARAGRRHRRARHRAGRRIVAARQGFKERLREETGMPVEHADSPLTMRRDRLRAWRSRSSTRSRAATRSRRAATRARAAATRASTTPFRQPAVRLARMAKECFCGCGREVPFGRKRRREHARQPATRRHRAVRGLARAHARSRARRRPASAGRHGQRRCATSCAKSCTARSTARTTRARRASAGSRRRASTATGWRCTWRARRTSSAGADSTSRYSSARASQAPATIVDVADTGMTINDEPRADDRRCEWTARTALFEARSARWSSRA